MNTEDHQNEQKVSETSQVNGCDGGYHVSVFSFTHLLP